VKLQRQQCGVLLLLSCSDRVALELLSMRHHVSTLLNIVISCVPLATTVQLMCANIAMSVCAEFSVLLFQVHGAAGLC
jgi:hypothetical protein